MTKLPLVLCGLFTGVVCVMGCRGGKTSVVPGTVLTIDFELPYDRPESEGAAFCAGARSVVLAFDEVPAEGWEHVVLLDTAGRLYGCGFDDQPCPPEQAVEHSFSPPLRVLAEWVDVAPEDYAHGPSNVICRGMFDAASNIGDLTIDVGSAGEEVFTVVIPLLRVGAMNGYFSRFNGTDQPAGTFLGVAPLVHPSNLALVNGALRTADGGKILAAGGWRENAARTDLFVFEPDDLAFERVLPGLPQGRAALTATPFAIDADEHFVLLAGGAGTDMAAQKDTWLFTGADGDGAALPGPPMFASRAHHVAERVSTITDATNVRSGIVVARGCDFNGGNVSSGAPEFLTAAPAPVLGGADGTQCGPTSNGVLFCRRPSNPPPVCQSSAAPVRRTANGLDTVLWIGGGGSFAAANASGSTDLSSDMRTTNQRVGTAPVALRGVAVSDTREPDTFFLIGGDSAPLGSIPAPTAEVHLVNGSAGTPVFVSELMAQRSFSTATRLLDERILVTGGWTVDSLLSSYELGQVIPGPSVTFSYEPLLDGISVCNGATGGGCSTMTQPRAEHSAVLLRGSTTWLNGAVIVVGGSDTAQPEIYVPAYECDVTGTVPVGMYAGEPFTVTEADFCDRNRAPLLPIMDPSIRQ